MGVRNASEMSPKMMISCLVMPSSRRARTLLRASIWYSLGCIIENLASVCIHVKYGSTVREGVKLDMAYIWRDV